MDGSILPPPPTPGNFQAPPAPGAFLPPAPAPGGRTGAPVGRPSADPEQQEARIERSTERKRLMAILPKQMVDGKLVAVRLMGRAGKSRPSNKACLTILFSELEAEKEAVGESFDTSRYVREKLEEKFDQGRFLIEARDKKDKLLPEFGEFEVNLSEDTDEDEEDDDMDLEEEQHAPPPPRYDHVPPPPPPFDPTVFAREVRQVANDEAKKNESTTNVVMQLMMAAQQDAARRDEERRREEREERRREQEREERRQAEEARRQEREDAREKERAEREREARRELRQTLMTLVPMALPILSKIMEGKPDTTMPMLLKMMDGKNDREGYRELMSLSTEASKQAMVSQGEATKHLLAAQAEGTKHIIGNVMEISKAMVQNMAEDQGDEEGEGGMLDKFGRVMKMLAPAITGLTQNSQAATVALPAPQQQTQPQAQPQQHSPAEIIRGGLYTLARLETGELGPEQRIPALQWCCRNLPSEVLTAIKSGDEGAIMATAAIGMDAKLTAWLSADEKHQEFLRKCLDDMKRMLVGAFTRADADASIAYQVAYQQAKTGAAPSEPAKPVKPAGKRPPPPAKVELAEPPEEPAKPAEAKASDKPAA